jgi:hypothetical protein
VSFWGSPDLSPGIENILNAMDLNDSSRSLIISMNLCNVKNLIQLSNLNFEDVSNLFSRKDLRDSVFQDTIIKVSCLGTCFQHSIKEKSGLDENEDITDHFIPNTFKQETDLLDEESMSILKRHYITCYWQLRKNFLDYLEDSMSQDSLIGSTISTRSKKNISCASNISSPSVLSQDTKSSKVTERSNKHEFYPKDLNHAFFS